MRNLGTWFVREGDEATLTLPSLREGNEESEVLFCDDRGTLLLPCYIEEADSDDLMLLKQYNADRVVAKLEMMEEYEGLGPGDRIRLERGESGRLSVEPLSVTSADDAM